MSERKIIQIFLFINLLIFVYGYLKGFHKPYWFDEVLTISLSQNIKNLTIEEIFTQDTHSPFFYIIIFISIEILNFFDLKNLDLLIFLRLINLIAIIPIYFSYKILKNNLANINLEIIFLLFISNYFFFFFSLELRMYFILLSFSLLISVINLNNSLETTHKFLFLISSIILSMLHIFGLTISMSILLYKLILNYSHGNYKNFKINLIFSIILFIIFILFYGPSLVDAENMKMFSWVKNNLWYYRVFIEWTLNSFISLIFFSFFLLFYLRSNLFNLDVLNKFFKSDFFKLSSRIIFPSIILMATTLIISFLFMPVITYRNLVVILPNIILFNGLLYVYFLKLKKLKYFIIPLLILITFININSYYQRMIKSHQNIKWVIDNTFKINCLDVPVYYNDAGRKNFLNLYVKQIVQVYANYSRPINNISDLNYDEFMQNLNQYENCKTFIFSFHNSKLKHYINELSNNDIKFDIKYAPNVRTQNSKSGAIAVIK
jgi:hypothetical protein